MHQFDADIWIQIDQKNHQIFGISIAEALASAKSESSQKGGSSSWRPQTRCNVLGMADLRQGSDASPASWMLTIVAVQVAIKVIVACVSHLIVILQEQFVPWGILGHPGAPAGEKFIIPMAWLPAGANRGCPSASCRGESCDFGESSSVSCGSVATKRRLEAPKSDEKWKFEFMALDIISIHQYQHLSSLACIINISIYDHLIRQGFIPSSS